MVGGIRYQHFLRLALLSACLLYVCTLYFTSVSFSFLVLTTCQNSDCHTIRSRQVFSHAFLLLSLFLLFTSQVTCLNFIYMTHSVSISLQSCLGLFRTIPNLLPRTIFVTLCIIKSILYKSHLKFFYCLYFSLCICVYVVV